VIFRWSNYRPAKGGAIGSGNPSGNGVGSRSANNLWLVDFVPAEIIEIEYLPDHAVFTKSDCFTRRT
jgi:hypothetical protein